MKRYPGERPGPDTGPGRSFRLLEESSPRQGIVLDLGCGQAPLGAPIKELGLDYVAVDVDSEALSEVTSRGFETAEVDLGRDRSELSAALTEIAGGRTISAVLAVDLLEHLIEPAEVLHAVRSLAAEGDRWPLIVSVPNVTHADIAAKLLLGRWDLTEFGLLDDTHLRFFSERLFSELFAATGWAPDGDADTVTGHSDQGFPIDAPVLRPGADARELLDDLSSRSHPHSNTYQFIRRFLPAEIPPGPHRWSTTPDADDDRVFATVLVNVDPGHDVTLERLLGDLDAQTSDDFETVVLSGGSPTVAQRPGVRIIEADAEGAWNAGLDIAEGRYLCFLDGSTRVSSTWIEAFRRHLDFAGHVLTASSVAVSAQRLRDDVGADTLVESGRTVLTGSLDLLQYGHPGKAIVSAHAVPRQVAAATGLRVEAKAGRAGPALFLTRAASLCGVVSLEERTVAVSGADRSNGEDDLDAIVESLDSAPLLLPAGSAARIVDMRRGLIEAHESIGWRITKPLRISRWLARRRAGAAAGEK